MPKVMIEKPAPSAEVLNADLNERAFLLSTLVASGDCGCDDTLALETTEAPPSTEGVEPPEGAKVARWEGPIGFEGVLTGDGRYINSEALRWVTPIPLRYVAEDVGAHDGAVVVGVIQTIERREGGAIWGSGVIDLESEAGREAFRQVDQKYTNGVSMDLDDVAFEVHVAQEIIDEMMTMSENDGPPEFDLADDGRAIVMKMSPDDEVSVTTDARVRAATIVAIPAFAEALISIVASGFIFSYNPGQARAPKGTPRGGQWVDTPTGLLSQVRGVGGGSTPFEGGPEGGEEVTVTIGGKNFKGRIAPPHGKEETLRQMGLSTPDLVRVENADQESAEAFKEAISNAKASSKFGSSVDVHDSYEGSTLYMTRDGLAGSALENGNIVSGFSHADNPEKGFIQHSLLTAIADGGDHLDCYDTVLPRLYAQVGFEPVARMQWVDDYAPDDWNYDLYSAFNGGRPDVVFMKLNPEGFGGTYDPSAGEYVQEWDEGVAAQGYSATSLDGHVDGGVIPFSRARGGNRRLVLGLEEAAQEGNAVSVGDLSHGVSVRSSRVVPKGTSTYYYNPSQARAPKGTPQGGRWIDTPTGLLGRLQLVRSKTTQIPPLAQDHTSLKPDAVDVNTRPYGEDVVAAANAVHYQAIKNEPSITSDFQTAVAENGVADSMTGLDFRVKAPASLATKIRAKSARPDVTPEMAASDIHDSIRYTVQADESVYATSVDNTLEALQSKGYEVTEVKDFWRDPTLADLAYKGVNVKVVSPDGVKIELQFHTEASQKVKDGLHILYDEQKLTTPGSPEYSAIEERMMRLVQESGLRPPSGYDVV